MSKQGRLRTRTSSVIRAMVGKGHTLTTVVTAGIKSELGMETRFPKCNYERSFEITKKPCHHIVS